MKIHPSPFEQMTALTDFILLIICGYSVNALWGYTEFKPLIWISAFILLGCASLFGAIAHGFEMSERSNEMIWKPLNLSLGLALGLFVVGALYDFRGAETARTALPVMLVVGVLFFVITLLIPGKFIVFIIYEAVAMVFALSVYIFLFSKAMAGASWVVAGISVTIIAAAVQASGKAGESIIWSFDNNGVFHLIQIPGILLVLQGLLVSLG